jgi:hypothetical protein
VTPPSVGRSTKYSNFVDCRRPQLATVSKLQLKQTNSVAACLLTAARKHAAWGLTGEGGGGALGIGRSFEMCLHLFADYLTTPSAG